MQNCTRLSIGILCIFFLLLAADAQAQTGSISGTVRDAATSVPLPNANLSLQGTTLGASSDVDGNYEITQIPAGTYTLVVTYVGFRRAEVQVQLTEGQSLVEHFLLNEDYLGLEEAVVTGYGSRERRAVTSSIAKISSESLQQLTGTSTDALLQGQASGVTVLRSSGTPGSGVAVRVRGATSISGSNQPLFVVDGVPVSSDDFSQLGLGNQGLNALSTIDPGDVASIEILKDAAATAIYGTRAANGVVLITTRRGQAGRTLIDADFSLGSNWFDNMPDLLSGPEYISVRNEGVFNDDAAGIWQAVVGVPFTSLPASFFDGGFFPGSRDTPYGVPNNQETTPFFDAITSPGLLQTYRLTFSGGNVRTRYLTSASYHNTEGAIVNSGFERLGARLFVDHSWPNDKARVSANVTYSRSQNERIFNDNTITGVITNALIAPPNQPVFTESGDFNLNFPFENPLVSAEVDVNAVDTKFLGSVTFEYDLTDAVTATLRSGLDRFDLRDEQFSPRFTLRGRPFGSVTSGSVFNQTWIAEATLSYRNILASNHSLYALGGLSFLERDIETVLASGSTFASDEIRRVNGSVARGGSGIASSNGLQSYFGTLEYGFRNKYLATATVRVDGSSRFGSENRFGVFPAYSLGWNLHEERFLNNKGWLEQLKIRSSLGWTGQQEIGNFASLGLFSAGGSYDSFPSLAPSQIANPDLKWETTRQFNIGLDAGFFGGRVGLVVDVYSKDTKDLLLAVPVPGTSGFGFVTQNVGEISNNGIEFSLNTINISRESFSWRSSINLTSNKNEVKALNLDQPFDTGFASRVAVGEPLGSFYGWVTEGVFRNAGEVASHAFQHPLTVPGDYKFADLNGDGRITTDDRTFIGDPNPDLFGGITNIFSLGNLELNVFLQFSMGNDVFNGTRQVMFDVGGDPGTTGDIRDRWLPSNPDTDIPRATFFDFNDNSRTSDVFVEDGSYLRLKALTVAYELPSRFVNGLNLRRLQLYVIGENLMTLTGYRGLDPEVSTFDRSNTSFGTDFFTYPQTKSLTFGVKVGL